MKPSMNATDLLGHLTSHNSESTRFPDLQHVSIAVLIPAFNEEQGIGNVIEGFRQAVPSAEIFVYDNNSSDHTAEKAARAGAIVRQEPRQGKGYVVRQMFADVDSDVYILVDGDDTYDSKIAQALVEVLILNGLDMINCARVPTSATAYRPGHKLGNRLLTGIVNEGEMGRDSRLHKLAVHDAFLPVIEYVACLADNKENSTVSAFMELTLESAEL